ncbi:hypothetical protein [Halpernia sp.]|uniref:hypothetical protein n=1 Tax=Halpernia sp. TaxID=2782209 RepID=UPI003A913828
MKKLFSICLLITTLFAVNAQETKKYFIVFETQSSTARNYINNQDNWKSDVPYKKFVRIIISPFDAPSIMDNGYTSALGNQLAEFIYKNHLKEFEKLKLHLRAFNYTTIPYTERDYKINTEDCTSCNYQHEKIIINGFKFKPVKEFTSSEYSKKMYTFITGKPWGKW